VILPVRRRLAGVCMPMTPQLTPVLLGPTMDTAAEKRVACRPAQVKIEGGLYQLMM